jgi:hypothetical protein
MSILKKVEDGLACAYQFNSFVAKVCVFTFIALSITSCAPKPEEMLPKIQNESQRFLDALNSGNESEAKDTLVDEAQRGLPAPLADLLEARKRDNTVKGYIMKSMIAGIPEMPQKADSYWVSFVPVETVFQKDPNGPDPQIVMFGDREKVVQSYLVAVSGDGGKKWKCLELGENRSFAESVLPQLKGKVVFPSTLMKVERR